MATTFYQKKNNAKSTITNNPLSAGGLSITLASSTGSRFPTTGATWLATIWDAVTYPDPADDPNMEVVLIDSRSTDTLTVNASGRGYAGTTGVSHATGSAIRLLIMKEHLTEHETAINAIETSLGTAVNLGTFVDWTSYTPTWGNTGTANTIGNGTITGKYMQIGKVVVAYINLNWGSTTAGGNGTWTFTLPPVSSAASFALTASGDVNDSSANATYAVAGSTAQSATEITLVSIGGKLTNAIPMIWASSDSLRVMVTYQAA